MVDTGQANRLVSGLVTIHSTLPRGCERLDPHVAISDPMVANYYSLSDSWGLFQGFGVDRSKLQSITAVAISSPL